MQLAAWSHPPGRRAFLSARVFSCCDATDVQHFVGGVGRLVFAKKKIT
jgi:hypothetical protein